MNRGQRVAEKTRSAIKCSLIELIREKTYPTVTVGEITQRANTGRSTFYKHYPSKADVLVDFHFDMFCDLFEGLDRDEKWLSGEPPEEWVQFFENSYCLGRNPFNLSYKLGSDLDYLIDTISIKLTKVVKKNLSNCFDSERFTIPLPILARSISELYRGQIMSWFSEYSNTEPKKFATYIQKMIRALIIEALDKES